MAEAEHSKQAEARVSDRYKMLEELAAGGSGIVYRVLDTRENVELALKVLRADKRDTLSTRLFREEYRTLCQLTHPRIVSVYEYEVSSAGAHYTMELLDGLDVREAAPLPVVEVCRLLRDVASALAMLHARRLLHRDVSYRNVRCTASGCAKLIDFGAMTTIGTTAEVIGTPPFIPPEAVHGKALEPRSDLYSLGALAYWMLTARHAYPASNLQTLQRLWTTEQPPRISELVEHVPPALDRLVMSMLSQDPQDRPASAAEVMDRLGAIADLPPAEDLGVAAAYLAKPALVGRERERTRIRDYLKREDDPRRRGPLLIEGAEGVGKTRMLEELVLEAKVAGWVVIGRRKSARAEPYALLRELMEQLLTCMPDLAHQVDAEDRALLARQFPGFGSTTLAAQTLSLGELRIRLHAALGHSQFPAADEISSEDDLYTHSALLTLTELSVPEQRAARALELILREVEAEDGFLYLTRGAELEFAASTTQRQAPLGLQAMLTEVTGMFDDGEITMTLGPSQLDGTHTGTILCDQQEFAPLHLLLNVDGERKLVGVVAVPLSSSGSELRVPDHRLLNAITASLYLSAPSASQTYDE